MSFRLYLLATAAAVAAFAPPSAANADNNSISHKSYECDLSGGVGGDLPGCVAGSVSGGSGTGGVVPNALTSDGNCITGSASPYCGARSDSGIQAILPIDAWHTCYWVNNNGTTPIFVPFKSSREWSQFTSQVQSAAQGTQLSKISLVSCAVPYNDSNFSLGGAPSFVAMNPPADPSSGPVNGAPYGHCATSSGQIPAPTVFGHSSASIWTPYVAGTTDTPVDVTFGQCGQYGNVTTTGRAHWSAGSATMGNNGWNQANIYSPAVNLSAAACTDGTCRQVGDQSSSVNIAYGASAQLTWSWDNNATACKSSFFGNLPINPTTAQLNVGPLATTDYTISCQNSIGLTSTATATVVVAPKEVVGGGGCTSGGRGGIICGGGGGGGGGGGCFTSGSLVHLADGRLKPIEAMQFGDLVRNAKGGFNMVLRREICALAKGSDLYGFDGGKPMVTALHPFVTNEGFAVVDAEGLLEKYPYFEDEIGSVSSLTAGTTLLSQHGPRRIESVQKYTLDQDATAYDLVLDGDQTFFVEGFAVRSQHDNAHAVRYLPHVLKDSARMARVTAVYAVYVSAGILVSPMLALAGGGSAPATGTDGTGEGGGGEGGGGY